MCTKTLLKDLKYILLHTYYKLDVGGKEGDRERETAEQNSPRNGGKGDDYETREMEGKRCAYIQVHTYVYTSVHVCALHIHMYVHMHMCVYVRTLFFKLTTQTTVRISVLKKRRKTQ